MFHLVTDVGGLRNRSLLGRRGRGVGLEVEDAVEGRSMNGRAKRRTGWATAMPSFSFFLLLLLLCCYCCCCFVFCLSFLGFFFSVCFVCSIDFFKQIYVREYWSIIFEYALIVV